MVDQEQLAQAVEEALVPQIHVYAEELTPGREALGLDAVVAVCKRVILRTNTGWGRDVVTCDLCRELIKRGWYKC